MRNGRHQPRKGNAVVLQKQKRNREEAITGEPHLRRRFSFYFDEHAAQRRTTKVQLQASTAINGSNEGAYSPAGQREQPHQRRQTGI